MTGPNILFLMADDHRHDAMGCAGDPLIRTPTMDRLAAEGLRCSRVHIMGGHSAAVCIPSRACMNTGRGCFAAAAGVSDHGRMQHIPPAHTTMGEAFAAAGYRTFHTGKWHLDPASLNRSFAEGRDMFLGGMHDHFTTPVFDRRDDGAYIPAHRRFTERHSTEVFADAAIGFIGAAAAGDRPFFLSCCFTSPHDPRTAPDEWHRRYAPADVQLPPNAMARHPFDNGELAVRDELLAAIPRDPDEVRRHIADYAAMIAHQDHHMGRILDALDAAGRSDDTIVVYTGDHGLAVGQHGLMGKQSCYDHSIRIPLLLRGPGLPRGATHDALLYGFDLFPTLCELAGVPIPESVHGRSFADLGPGRPSLYSVYCDAMAAVTDGRRKLIRSYRRATGAGDNRLQLFDLEADPWELDDRSTDPAQRAELERLGAELGRWQRELGDPLAAQDPLAPAAIAG